MNRTLRAVVVLVVGGAVVGLAAERVIPRTFLPRDFLEYWAAGRLNLRGADPYDPRQVLAEQQLAEPHREHAVMMWNPPPALALYMPLGLLPPRWAALLWVGAQVAAVVAACDLLWRTYCPHGRGLGAAVAASFVGTWWLIGYGQNTGFLLLGLAGFLHFTRREKPFAAGACAALTALKPHLLAVFGVLLIADVLTRRGRQSLLAGAGVILLALGVAVAANPAVVEEFVEAVRHPAEGAVPLSAWWLPVPAFWLRKWLAFEHFWVQFVPCALACAASLAYRARAGAAWDWSRALPLAVAVSVLATPYGGWVFDLPVLLVPAVWTAARLARDGRFALLRVFVAGQAAVTAVSFATAGGLHEFWWVAPTALALCLLAVVPPIGSRGTSG